ncbi:MAG: hypothetical protein GY852_06195 [bacterium]|nr:hypothetical protein [bacterium]
MNSNGTANKGGKGPLVIKKEEIRPASEAMKRQLFGNFLRSSGVNPDVVDEFKSRRTMIPDSAPQRPRTLMDDILGGRTAEPEKAAEVRPTPAPEQVPAEPVLGDIVREPEPDTEPESEQKGTRDGYSIELSLANLGNLSQSPEMRAAQAELRQDAGPDVAISVIGADLGDDIEIDINSRPPEMYEDSSEGRDNISQAVIQAAAQMTSGLDPLKLPSDKATIPPPAPVTAPVRGEDGHRGPLLPGSPEPEPFVGEGHPREGEEMSGRTRERLSELSQMEQAAEIPLGNNKLREKSYVPIYVEGAKQKLPERFRPYIEDVMGILEKNLKGSEGDVEKLIIERRWKIEREQRVLGSIATSADEIQRVFAKMHKNEAVRRVNLRTEEGTMIPADAIKTWAFTVLSSRSPKDETTVMADSNVELNVFDAYAKAVTFLFLSQMRPTTFIHVLGHSDISKPYGQLGGMEGLGVLAGLDLPDVASAHHIANPMIGLAFRHAQECRSTTLIGWLQDTVVRWPKPFIVGRFAAFVEQEMRDFQEAVQGAGFTAERLFQVLNRKDNSPSDLRADPVLNHIFEAAATGSGSVVYGEPDDVFDALEAIVGYTNLLRQIPNAKNEFLEHFLETYPLTTNGGTFWKVFNMCLFTDKEDMENNPNVVKAFRKDPDRNIKIHIEDAIHQLQPRATLIAASTDNKDDPSIRFSLNDDEF